MVIKKAAPHQINLFVFGAQGPYWLTQTCTKVAGVPKLLDGMGVRDICVASACAHARHTDDMHAFPQTTLFVVSKSMLIAPSVRHLLVTEKTLIPCGGERENTYKHNPPKNPRTIPWHFSYVSFSLCVLLLLTTTVKGQIAPQIRQFLRLWNAFADSVFEA